MAISTYDSGFGSTGPLVLTREPFVHVGAVIWVDSVLGSDSNAGTKRTAPKATIFGASGAISVATTGQSDLIVCEKTHRETVSSAYTFSKTQLILASLGSGTDVARITSAVAGVTITLSGAGNEIHNFYFPASTAATTAKISITAASNHLRGCRFDSGANDAADQVLVSAATAAYLKDLSFYVTAAPSGTTQTGLTVTGASTYLRAEGLTFDGSTFGWTQDALSIEGTDADGFKIDDTTLSNNSRIVIASGSKGRISGYTIDDGQAVVWTE